jgi:hypothetical protein
MSMSRLVMAVAVLAVVVSGGAFARGGGGGGGHGGGGGGHGGGGGGHGGGHFGGGHFGGGHIGGGHFGGAHFGGGHFRGGGHFAGAHHFGGAGIASHGGQHFGNAAVSSRNVRSALNSFSHGHALRNARILSSPMARAQLAAGAAVVGWHGGSHGWWQHPNGGYGWVGPLFWPFAYYDIYDYTLWGYGAPFWDYGYLDLYAGLFGPYGYSGLSGYAEPRPRGRAQRGAASFAQMCADDDREVAGLPIDQIGQAIAPTEAQRAALDDLAAASIKAAQTIRASCPAQVAATAPGRLAAMQQRLEAMISAVALVRPPLERLYGLLDDEQKARINAVAEDERKRAPANSVAECGRPATPAWPAEEIETRLHPTDTQRAALKTLQDAAAHTADTVKAACQPTDLLTPPARLDAVARRLDTMLEAVKSVRSALDDFYATLSDEQKAQFEAIGPRRTS